MPNVRKAELLFLYTTCFLVLFYISTKYHQNTPKDIRVTEWTRNLFQTKQREIIQKVGKSELSFLYATRRLILFYIYPSIIKIFQRVFDLQRGQNPNQTKKKIVGLIKKSI